MTTRNVTGPTPTPPFQIPETPSLTLDEAIAGATQILSWGACLQSLAAILVSVRTYAQQRDTLQAEVASLQAQAAGATASATAAEQEANKRIGVAQASATAIAAQAEKDIQAAQARQAQAEADLAAVQAQLAEARRMRDEMKAKLG